MKPKPCANLHHMPKFWREENHSGTVKTFCNQCGKWIGNRPAVDSKSKR
jgi:hypothetical protein